MVSPLRADVHGDMHGLIMGWLHDYRRFLPGIILSDNPILRTDEDNEPQPDAVLRLHPSRAGSSWLDDSGCLQGVPELVVEIAASSAHLDAGEKRDLYERIGVPEYILWRTLDDSIDWWSLVDGTYQPLPMDAEGVIRSDIFPGLWLHVPGMIQGNIRLTTGILEAGLASAEHKYFASRLNP